MTYLTRFSLGCVVIALLSLCGCATNSGGLLPHDQGTAVVFGTNKADPAVSEGDPGASVVRGDRWWQ